MDVRFVCNTTKNFTFITDFQQWFDPAKKQKQWPKAKISRIEPSGLLHIKFLQKMKIPERPYLIANETILLNGTYYPILTLEMVPGKLTDPQLTSFNWTYIDFTS